MEDLCHLLYLRFFALIQCIYEYKIGLSLDRGSLDAFEELYQTVLKLLGAPLQRVAALSRFVLISCQKEVLKSRITIHQLISEGAKHSQVCLLQTHSTCVEEMCYDHRVLLVVQEVFKNMFHHRRFASPGLPLDPEYAVAVPSIVAIIPLIELLRIEYPITCVFVSIGDRVSSEVNIREA